MLRFEDREKVSIQLRVMIPLISILLGISTGGIAMIFSKINPFKVYKAIFIGAFGNTYSLSETIVVSIPLILMSVGLVLVFKMHYWNIGAYGQYIMGAIFGTYFAINSTETVSRFYLLTLMFIFGIIGGVLWSLIPSILKGYWKVNEVITTLLLNYIALYILKFLMYGPWRNPKYFGFPLTETFNINSQLPKLIPKTRIHFGLIFAIVASIIIWYLINRTVFGYEIKAIGHNEIASKCAGISIEKNIVIATAISGGLSGLAGFSQVSGLFHMLQIEINAGYGYTAIIIAWLSGLNPLISILVSLFFGGLFSGISQIQITMKVPIGIVGLIEGSILFFLLGGAILTNYKLYFKRRESI